MTLSRPGIVWVFALICAIGCTLPAAASASDIIVRRDAGLSAAERAAIRADAGVQHEHMLRLPEAEVVSVPDGREDEALAALNADPDVRYAEPVVELRTAGNEPETNDQFYDRLWQFDNTGQVVQRVTGVEDADMDVPEAWAVSRGAGQVIAVVDTGVASHHPDLQGRLAPGRSFVQGITTTADDDGHGTTVTGALVATADNSIGIAGIAPEATVLPLKAFSVGGTGTSVSVGDALAYAGAQGVRVVNLSSSGPDYNQYLSDVMAAYPQTLFVVAAGNGADYGDKQVGDDNDGPPAGESGPQYPCNLPLANLICVGSSNNVDEVSSFSNYGAVSVDLFAPGEYLYTTRVNRITQMTSYGYERGTSLSVPMVAGEAALLLAKQPNLTTASLRTLLLRNVDPLPTAAGRSVTGGRANAGRLLATPVPDADADGVLDELDNCPAVADTLQRDTEGDGVGDVCDPTPRGDDPDHDGRPFLDDRCPTVFGSEPDGCPQVLNPPDDGPGDPTPTPTPTHPGSADPRVVSLGVSLTPKRCPRGRSSCSKSAKVTVKLTRSATVSLRLEQKTKRNGRTVWKRITTKSLKATTSARSLTMRRLKRGSYRVTATVAGKSKTYSFKV